MNSYSYVIFGICLLSVFVDMHVFFCLSYDSAVYSGPCVKTGSDRSILKPSSEDNPWQL
jgi:hypothetical protein